LTHFSRTVTSTPLAARRMTSPSHAPFQPHFSMNDYTGLAPALAAGAGIGELPPVVQPGLFREGRLVEVMPDWRFRAYDLSLVQVGNRHVTKPCRLFKDLAAQMAPSLFPDLPM
jgi:DNA-binding transcriptional LysR family regulator